MAGALAWATLAVGAGDDSAEVADALRCRRRLGDLARGAANLAAEARSTVVDQIEVMRK